MLEALVERLHAHGANTLGDQVANRIVDHGGSDAGVQAKAIRQVGGAIELAAANVDAALGRFAKRNDARIKTVDQRAERKKIEFSGLADIQTVFHSI